MRARVEGGPDGSLSRLGFESRNDGGQLDGYLPFMGRHRPSAQLVPCCVRLDYRTRDVDIPPASLLMNKSPDHPTRYYTEVFHRKRRKVLLAAVSLLISFTAAEVAARLVLPPPMQIGKRRFWDSSSPKHVPDPELGWIIEPGNTRYRFRAASESGSVDVGYSIEQGRRATSARPAAGPLLIAAGCSFTFGYGVA